jgi:hypothetical protein
VRTVSLYRYRWAGALCLVAALCVTALVWFEGFLARCRTLPDAFQERRGGCRLGALCTLLLLLTLLVGSGPHLVHLAPRLCSSLV